MKKLEIQVTCRYTGIFYFSAEIIPWDISLFYNL